MLKVKDWPPDDSFSEKLPRHDQVEHVPELPCGAMKGVAGFSAMLTG